MFEQKLFNLPCWPDINEQAEKEISQSPYLSALDFRILDFGVYFKLGKKSSSKPTWFFFEFELDFYCLCSLQKSISKSNWFFSFLNLIFWNWKKFEWHSISQKSSGDRQGESLRDLPLGCATKDLDWFLGPLYKLIEYCRNVLLLPVIPLRTSQGRHMW